MFQTNVLCSFPSTRFKFWGLHRSLICFVLLGTPGGWSLWYTGFRYSQVSCQWLESETKLTLRYILCLFKTLHSYCVILFGKLHPSGTSRTLKQTLKGSFNYQSSQCVFRLSTSALPLDSGKRLRHFQDQKQWCSLVLTYLVGQTGGA